MPLNVKYCKLHFKLIRPAACCSDVLLKLNNGMNIGILVLKNSRANTIERLQLNKPILRLGAFPIGMIIGGGVSARKCELIY